MRPTSRLKKGTAAAIVACLLLTGCKDTLTQQALVPQAQANQPAVTTQEQPSVQQTTQQTVHQPAVAVPDNLGSHRRMEPHFEESELPATPKIQGAEPPSNYPVPVAAVEQPQEPPAETQQQQQQQQQQVFEAPAEEAPQPEVVPEVAPGPEVAPQPEVVPQPEVPAKTTAPLQPEYPVAPGPQAEPTVVEPNVIEPQQQLPNPPPNGDQPEIFEGPEVPEEVIEAPDDLGDDPETTTSTSGESSSSTTTTETKKTSETPSATNTEKPDGAVREFASIAEARQANVTDNEFIVTDGESAVRFVRGLDFSAGADIETQIGDALYGTKFETEISLLAYEFSDDATEVIQHALSLAGQRQLGVALSPTQNYVITKRVSVPKNVQYLDGKGATIDVNTSADQDNPTSTFEFVRGASGTTIENFTIDLSDAPFTRGIAAVAVSDIAIMSITMKGLSYRGIELAADGGPLKNIRVEKNRIENIVGEKETKGQVISISVNSERNDPDDRFKNSASPIWDRYVTDGTVSPNRFENSNISIVGNYIHGGYYGISFSGVSDSVIRDNQVTANTRNISMQNNCNNNVVEHNQLSNSYSSSVHIAYNSNRNQVLNNTIISEVSHGQGLLQAYQDSDANIFRGNAVTVVGEHQPSWLLYVGTDSDDNSFVNNTIDGGARRAIVGIESIWDGRSAESNLNGAATNMHSYMSNGTIQSPVDHSKVTYGGGRGPLNNVTVEDNVFTPRNPATPLVYVGAEVTGGQVGNERIIGDVRGVSLANNTIVGAGCSELLKIHTGELPEIGAAKIDFRNDTVGEQKINP